MMNRHFDESTLTGLLDQLHEFFGQPSLVIDDGKKAREQIAKFLSLVMDKAKQPEQVARDVSEWLEEYLECVPESLE